MRAATFATAAAGLGLLAGLFPGQVTTAGPVAGAGGQLVEVQAPVPAINFGDCPRGYPKRVRCARAEVPIDYDAPDGETVSLFLTRRRARDAGARIGTLFANPGGPGGSAADFVAFGGTLFPDRVQDRFDIVGIDPRGIGGSAQVRCVTDADGVPFPRVPYPITRPQIKRQIAFDDFLRKTCRTGGSRILDHMTTADTARDMDLVRQGLGEDQISYYGISYGSYLGTTYAAMFPDSFRALAVDAVLDPIAWATGRRPGEFRTEPFSARLRSEVGAFESLVDAFAACDRVGKPRCALAGRAERTWRRMLRQLEDGPVQVEDFGKVHYQDLVGVALGSLYAREAIPPLFRLLEQLSRRLLDGQSSGPGVAAAAGSLRSALRTATRADLVPGPYVDRIRWLWGDRSATGANARRVRFFPSFEGVSCSDTRNPRSETRWNAAARRAELRGRWFGRIWTWASSPCASWPGSGADAYRGPFDVETSAPLLVIGNTHDPATAYQGAVTVTDLFPRSGLLTLDDYGHAAFAANSCVDRHLGDYLVRLDLPTAGRVCRPEAGLFPRRD